MLRLVFLMISFWSSRLDRRRRRSLYLDGKRRAAFHTFVKAVCTINAHIGVAAGEDDGEIVDRIKLLEAYHAMEGKRRRRHGQ
jgi:hypothetical protein